MTKDVILGKLKSLEVFIFTLLFGVLTFAQDSAPDATVKVETTKTTTSSEEWISNPVYWVVGAILFTILVAVIMRSGRKD